MTNCAATIQNDIIPVASGGLAAASWSRAAALGTARLAMIDRCRRNRQRRQCSEDSERRDEEKHRALSE
jgi:hypothetical protein